MSVETYFGTSPPFWNDLFVLMANIIPQRVLKDRVLMDLLARISLPMVRAVDAFVGSKNGTYFVVVLRLVVERVSDIIEGARFSSSSSGGNGGGGGGGGGDRSR